MEHKSLREYIQLVESAQQVQAEDANTAGNVAGQAVKTAVNTATAAPRAIWDGVKWLYNKGADAVSGAVQGVQDFASGAAQGFTQGGIDPLHPVDSAQAAQQSLAASGNGSQGVPQQGATPAKPQGPAMAPDALKKIQQQLGVAADGIMGPKTQAAIKAFQQKNGLAVDGIVGPKTQAALQASSQAAQTAPPAQTTESVGYDEVQRIVSLVHYR